MAWLVAFNDGLFDGLDAAGVGRRLAALIRGAESGAPALADGREAWQHAVDGWIGTGEAR